MQFLIPLTTLLALGSALIIPEFETTPANSTVNLERRMKSMNGKCVRGDATQEAACKVPKGQHSAYACRNSNCKGKMGAKCVIAPAEHGEWVAKCPVNLLPYEWDWPWHP
ncbi:uncharacterized protein AB675_4248 [Cyphellophora attinorum]|uniref:Secreted protein n=1 Tax=Cyphellophora attinorum TaxID=1664694 RepID=A0A0N1H7F6_9EURO|nr:uncharacterized protein AB675_4248 [Phialophora attinorum]KPI38605.1 hypothetical protein AB675_4248 [Phialophora attinorum]